MLPGWTSARIAGKPADAFDPPGGARFALLYLHPVGLESLAADAAWTAELERHRFACCAPFGARSWWADRVCPEFDPERTAERHLLDNVLPWMAERWPAILGGRGSRRAANHPDGSAGASPSQERPSGLAVAGISMGGQGALRLGFKHPERFPVVAGVASAIEYERWYGRGTPLDDMYRSREACRQDTAGLHIRPMNTPPHIWFACDPADEEWHRGNDRLHEKLLALGVAHEADLETERGGHTWAYFDAVAPRLFAWLTAALEKQARRLM